MSAVMQWKRFQRYLCRIPAIGLTLDISRMGFDDKLPDRMAQPLRNAFDAMDALERGGIANPDEDRMVGHYWLRAPQLAPTEDIANEIRNATANVSSFAAKVH